jgi:hypothetical protein
MKSILSCFVFLLALACTLTAQSSVPLIADVPFPFFVGNQQMPAGEYRFALRPDVGRTALAVRDENGAQVFVLSFAADAKKKGEENWVVFTKYANNRHFLRQIVHAGDITASETLKSRTERQSVTSTLHAGNYPTKVVIVARVR